MTEGGSRCVRVAEGGEVLDELALDDACFACALGGETGSTLYLMLADWRGPENMGQLFAERTGRIVAAGISPSGGRDEAR
jgi:sugar lactone lactonase YvrE